MDGRAYDLIVRNLQEVVGDEELRRQVALPCVTPDDRLSLYWGTATTGRPHVAYFVPIIKLADFLRAGCKVIVLFADLHGYLDNMKAPWPLLQLRTRYYEAVIKGMLQSINVPLERLTFFRGADFELTEAYAADLYRLLAVTSVHDARKAGAEVVKQVANPLVSGLLYPLLQANDEVHLGVLAQFGGVDQRKIFMLAEKYLPHIGQKKRIHLMNPMVPGLTGGKMSSSEVDSKIDLLDGRETVSRKLAQAVCSPGQSADGGNGILAFLKYVVFPLTGEDQGLLIPGHTEAYRRFGDLEADFLAGRLSGDALKQVVSDCLNDRLDVIRDQFAASLQLTDLIQQAYPTSSQVAGVDALSSEMADVSISPIHSKPQEELLSRRLDEMTQRLKPIQNQDAVLRTIQKELSGLEPDLNRTHQLIQEGGRIRLLWSVTPVGLPHLGYSLPMRSLAKLSRLDGVLIVILVNNVAAHLRGAIPWDLVVPRGTFYRTLLTGLFKAYWGRTEQMVCVLGSEYQLGGDFMLEFYHLVSMVPESDCQAALVDSDLPLADTPEDSELICTPVLGQSTTTVGSRFVLGQLLLPCLDLIDSIYLRADIRLAGEATCRWRRAFEQRMVGKFLTASRLVCLSHPLLPGLLTTGDGDNDEPCLRPMQPCQPVGHQRLAATGQQLWSEEDACLPLVEPASAGGVPGGVLAGVKRRLKKAFCRPGLVEVNPVLDLYRHVLLPELAQQDPLVIPRSEKNGGPIRVTTEDTSLQCRWAGLCYLFAEGTLHPGDLKPAVEAGLTGILTDRLTTCLPAWSHMSVELEAAFPAASKQKGKAKAKSTSKQKVVGDKSSSGLCNGSSPAAVSSQPVTKGGSRSGKPETDDNDAGDMDPNRLDIRVGRIVSVKQHPNADKLYVQEVDLGTELGSRTVCSGLVGHVPRERLENLLGAFVVNLKPATMRGVVSQAMLLCTSHESGDNQLGSTQPIQVHDSLCPGTRLVFQPPPTGANAEMPGQPDAQIGPNTRLLDRLAVDLTVSAGPDRCVSWRQWRLGPATGSADGVISNNCA